MKSKVRDKLYARDGYRCQLCGLQGERTGRGEVEFPIPGVRMTLDHIVPKCLGGTDAQDNLQSCCSICNNAKGHWHDGPTEELNKMVRDAWKRFKHIPLNRHKMKGRPMPGVYFVQTDTDIVKVGHAKRICKKIKEFKGLYGLDCVLLVIREPTTGSAILLKKSIHKQFSKEFIGHGEFMLSPRINRYIDSKNGEINKPPTN